MTRRVFKVSPRFYADPAVMRAGNSAIGLWALSGSWVAGQDEPVVPAVPASVIRTWSRSNVTEVIAKLVRVGLWELTPGHLHSDVYEDAWSFVPNDALYVFAKPGQWRPAISPALRERVYERDGYRCMHCDSGEWLSLDHIHPYSLGGADTFDNFQTLCTPCNSRKGARV